MSHLDHFAKRKRQKDSKICTKIVMRRLPPNFTLEIFKEQVAPIPEYNYFYFVQAEKIDGHNIFSRVYINFLNHKDVCMFKEKYDSYVFLGPKGTEYPAVVEYAPFQKLPKNRLFQKQDVKCGTIQNHEYYLQFVENLQSSKCEIFERSEYDLQLNSQLNESENLTPLLKYISAKKSKQGRSPEDRKKELKQRYENCMVFVNSSVKKSGTRRAHMKRRSQ